MIRPFTFTYYNNAMNEAFLCLLELWRLFPLTLESSSSTITSSTSGEPGSNPDLGSRIIYCISNKSRSDLNINVQLSAISFQVELFDMLQRTGNPYV